MSSLRLGPGFTLPIDVMTDKVGILGQSGSGKTTAAADVAEEIAKAAQQFVVLDPKGDWWGIRSSADGKSPGLAVTVFGGLHGDLPIYPESGVTVAQLVVSEGISAVVDVSDFESDGQRHRFTTDFANALYKAKQRAKSPILFVLEEADESCPQTLTEPTEARMVGAIKRLAKLGRFCGIGVLILSQRAADVNKKVLSQMSVLIAMRTWHATDLKAIAAALKEQVPKALFDEVMAALPSLETGEAYVVAPHRGIKQKVRFRNRETFDAGETPKVGQARREPKVLAPVQLEALRARMAAEVERAKADDPKELRAELAKAKAEVVRLQRAPAQPVLAPPRVVEKVIEVMPAGIAKAYGRLAKAVSDLGEEIRQTPATNTKPVPTMVAAAVAQSRNNPGRQVIYGTPTKTASQPAAKAGGSLPKGEAAVLTAVAEYPNGILREQITVLTGYKRSSRDTYLQRLRERGYIQVAGDRLTATQAGIDALGPHFTPLPRGAALRDHWMQRLPEGERRVLEVLVAAYPEGVERQAIDDATGYKRSSRDTYLQRLRGRELTEANGNVVLASSNLFEGA